MDSIGRQIVLGFCALDYAICKSNIDIESSYKRIVVKYVQSRNLVYFFHKLCCYFRLLALALSTLSFPTFVFSSIISTRRKVSSNLQMGQVGLPGVC